VAVESPEEYCRAIEAYLCRKNDGHLVRIVGPAFEQVIGWATRGVPLTVAYGGIDRYFERYYAKGPRRRPVRIEFCEADVLDAFDAWRRAVGVVPDAPGPRSAAERAGAAEGADATETTGGPGQARRHQSLPAHLERVIARLTVLRGPGELDEVLAATIRELDAIKATSAHARGDARQALVDRLHAMDEALIAEARQRCDAQVRAGFEREAEAELAPFRSRIPPEALAGSHRAAVDRLIRDRYRLPVIGFD
jgi:hypothetical protein